MSDDDWLRHLHTVLGPLAALVRTLSPHVLGLSGPPGSGKSTLARQLAAVLGTPGLDVLVLSLDDFCFSRRERGERGIEWRAGPGSHDLPLLHEVLAQIRNERTPIIVPRYSALNDDRAEPETLTSVPGLVILEGWLLGYRSEGYENVLDDVDFMVFVDVDVSTARSRRFAREQMLRDAGGGFAPSDMQRFWDDVLEPGISRLVPEAKSNADLVLHIGEESVQPIFVGAAVARVIGLGSPKDGQGESTHAEGVRHLHGDDQRPGGL